MPFPMVSRCDDKRQPVLILDLDGTLLGTNSFPHWVQHLARARFDHLGTVRRAAISLAVFTAFIRRRLRLLDHAMFKYRLQQIWQDAVEGDDGAAEQQMIAELRRFVRPEFAPLLADVAADRIDAVLATAAAGDYALGLGRALGFTHILATPVGRAAPRNDNAGRQKRDAVLQLLLDHGWHNRPLILYTDHVDDLPLIRISQTTYWFGSDEMRLRIERDIPETDLRPGLRKTHELALST
jgi:phosphoserine phosphatase